MKTLGIVSPKTFVTVSESNSKTRLPNRLKPNSKCKNTMRIRNPIIGRLGTQRRVLTSSSSSHMICHVTITAKRLLGLRQVQALKAILLARHINRTLLNISLNDSQARASAINKTQSLEEEADRDLTLAYNPTASNRYPFNSSLPNKAKAPRVTIIDNLH